MILLDKGMTKILAFYEILLYKPDKVCCEVIYTSFVLTNINTIKILNLNNISIFVKKQKV